jgi:hypothetical protein
MKGCFTQEVRCGSSLVGRKVQLAPAQPRQQVQRAITCQAVVNVKLPATHLQSTQAALKDIQASKNVNRKLPSAGLSNRLSTTLGS